MDNMDNYRFCPDEGGCNIPYVSCPALGDKGNGCHLDCDIYKANHFFETATNMLNEICAKGPEDNNIASNNITPSLIEEKELGLDLHDMPKETKEKIYMDLSLLRSLLQGEAEKIIEGGCRMNRYLRALHKMEDMTTTELGALEKEGIKIECGDNFPERVYKSKVTISASD